MIELIISILVIAPFAATVFTAAAPSGIGYLKKLKFDIRTFSGIASPGYHFSKLLNYLS